MIPEKEIRVLFRARKSQTHWTFPLDCKEIQPVHSKGDQSWLFFGRNDAKAETPVLWSPHAKNWLIGKDSDAGREWGQVEKGTTEDEMDGWHHRLDGREFEWTPGVDDGQGGLACCDSWGHKKLDTTEQQNRTELNNLFYSFSFWSRILNQFNSGMGTVYNHIIKGLTHLYFLHSPAYANRKMRNNHLLVNEVAFLTPASSDLFTIHIAYTNVESTKMSMLT